MESRIYSLKWELNLKVCLLTFYNFKITGFCLMKFTDYYNSESEVLNEGLLSAAVGGLLFASILRQLSLRSVPVYVSKNSNVMPASRSAYQKLMDKFAVSYKEYLSAKKAGVNDVIDKLTGKKVKRNEMRNYKEKYNGAIVKKAYKGILKSHGDQLGRYDDVKSVMVYRTNNGGTVTFINTEENGLDRYFVIMDDAAEKFFIKYQGSTISSYITKYNDRNYKSPGAFGVQDTEDMVKHYDELDDAEEAEIAKEKKTRKFYDEYMAKEKARQMRDVSRKETEPSEDEKFNAVFMKHYRELLARNIARDFAKTTAGELARKEVGDMDHPIPDVDIGTPDEIEGKNIEWRLVLNSAKFNGLLKRIDYLKRQRTPGLERFTITNVGNLTGQRNSVIYNFADGSKAKLYYSEDANEYRFDFYDDAVDRAKKAGMFDIKGFEINKDDIKEVI